MNKFYYLGQLLLIIVFFESHSVLSELSTKSNLAESSSSNETTSAYFFESESHRYGFDDYTNWISINQYYINWTPYATSYSNRIGKCLLPYLSVAAGEHGYVLLYSRPKTKNILAKKGNENDQITITSEFHETSPSFIFKEQLVDLIPGSSWFPQACSILAKIDDENSEHDNESLATLHVSSYQKLTKKILFVKVKDINQQSSYPNLPISANKAKMDKVLLQAATEVTLGPTDSFVYPHTINNNGIWSYSDIINVRDAYLGSSQNKTSQYDDVFLVLPGSKIRVTTNGMIKEYVGMTYSERKISLIFFESSSPYVAAHEFCHVLGLNDVYNNDTFTPGKDKMNVMNLFLNTSDINYQYRLRKGQWDTIQRINN